MDQPPAIGQTPVPQPAPSDKQQRRVLCIEDEHFISELYVRALTNAGYQVVVKADGAEGLAEAQTDQYDIILLDLMVPSMTGTDILRHLRDPAAAQIRAKILVTTNLEQREETRNDIESHADGYLIKAEITPRELVDILNRV